VGHEASGAEAQTVPRQRPFELALSSRWRYYVVYPEGALRQRKMFESSSKKAR
jgi:hypothetical protein